MKLKWKDDVVQSPLGRAKGLGSSHHGTHHWWMQRVTAISNFVLMAWLVFAVIMMPGWTHGEFTSWLAHPINAILMILAIISTFYHAALGVQVVMEDYISCTAFRVVKLWSMKLFFTAGAVACIFSILKIAL
jgi:succinate dehydrogenase / fumarate reductase membrane anchor subunit